MVQDRIFRARWLYLFELREIHTQALLTEFAMELHLDKLRTLLHLAFEDRAFAKGIMAHVIAGLELLLLWLCCWRRSRRCFRG